ncbi:MAG TPA: transposase [Gemmataceae bacterium]|nr:transposase [Gemmataceae bacterium]
MGEDLLHDPLFWLFAEQRPVATMAQMALRHLLDPQALHQVFQTHAQRQREATVPFAALTQMLASVVLSQEPSVNAAIKKYSQELGASHQAVYGKLQRVETSTARGLVQYSYERLVAVQQALGPRGRQDLAGYATRLLDGNHLAATEHRLKETRGSTAAPLPGKTLVVYSPRRDAIVDSFPIEDGHAQERSALDAVLETVQARQLWVADRNFCTVKFLYGIAAARAAFIIRQHGQLVGRPLGKPRRVGQTETGVVYEQKFRLPPYDGRALVIRRVIVQLRQPTRDGDHQIALLTNLPRQHADAVAVSEQYRHRWRIEVVMQRLTESLRCEIRPLCYPQAALFGFALALVMYNVLAILRAAIDAAHGRGTSQTLSHYYLALEIAQATDGMLVALAASRWAGGEAGSSEALAQQLVRIAAGMDLGYYAKSTRGPKKPKPKPQHVRHNVHVSTKKVLDQRRK